MPTSKIMRYVCVEITIVLTIFWVQAALDANNVTTDKNEERQSILQVNGSTVTSHYHKLVKRCWNKVISGRPTLAKVVVAGSFFVLFALVAGAGLFFYIYFRHKGEFAEIEEELASGKRRYKPHPEDARSGTDVSKRGWWERLSGKKRIGDVEAPEEEENHQVPGEDLGEPNQTMTQRKPTGADGKDHHRGKLKTRKKGGKSKKFDPKKKSKKSQSNINLRKKVKSDPPNHKEEEVSEKPKENVACESLEDLWNMRMQEVGRATEEEKRIHQWRKVQKEEAANRVKWEESRVPPPAPNPLTARKAWECSQK